MSITFTTCWYQVRSKFDAEVYRQWMAYFLENANFHLVIYTNKESLWLVEPFQRDRVKIVLKEWEDFKGYTYKDQWIKNHEKNHLLNENSPWKTDWKLNLLWAEKVHFVKETATYFESDWYAWCDIGYFREPLLSPEQFRAWPNPSKVAQLQTDKIYYGLPGARETINLFQQILQHNRQGPYIPLPPDRVTVAGGFFLISSKKVDWWTTTFSSKLAHYFEKDYLVKDDQIIIIDCILNDPSPFLLVEESDETKNRWFVFQAFLN